MRISRRDFLKYCSVTAGALGLTATDLLKIEEALAVNGALQVVWLNGQACTGCTVSLANSVYYVTIQDLLLYGAAGDSIDLICNETLSASMGDQFLPAVPTGAFVLAVEGAIPTKDKTYCEIANTITGSGLGGTNPVTIYDAVTYYAGQTNCGAVLSIGTCASYGGIPAGKGNVTGAKGVSTVLNGASISTPVVNIPGCPPNPNWIVGTIAFVLANGGYPAGVTLLASKLDNISRPNFFFGGRQCTKCNRFDSGFYDKHFVAAKRDADEIGDPAKTTWCLRRIGCKGPKTQSDCSYRQWHSPAVAEFGVNWCVGAGAPCQGCTQADFPDHQGPFLNIL